MPSYIEIALESSHAATNLSDARRNLKDGK